jgi:hypothetical protein
VIIPLTVYKCPCILRQFQSTQHCHSSSDFAVLTQPTKNHSRVSRIHIACKSSQSTLTIQPQSTNTANQPSRLKQATCTSHYITSKASPPVKLLLTRLFSLFIHTHIHACMLPRPVVVPPNHHHVRLFSFVSRIVLPYTDKT